MRQFKYTLSRRMDLYDIKNQFIIADSITGLKEYMSGNNFPPPTASRVIY